MAVKASKNARAADKKNSRRVLGGQTVKIAKMIFMSREGDHLTSRSKVVLLSEDNTLVLDGDGNPVRCNRSVIQEG